MAIDNQKPKAIEYLNNNSDQKESVRDFIQNARKILISQIAINDKREETERLNEYIIMEKEKLVEAKKTFDEDEDKFKKYMTDLNDKAEKTADDVKKLINEKTVRIQEINSLEQEISNIKSDVKKIDENLVLY